ncbi:MAG: ester cyclase [Candidatus Acidiferrales bacterium]
MTKHANIETLKRAIGRFNSRDVDGYLEMYDKSVVFHGFPRRLKPGVAGMKDYYSQVMQAFPDMRIATDDAIAEGEKVAHRCTFYGTHRGEYLGVAPSMKLVISPGLEMYLFRGGLCVETWRSMDNLGFATQIGAVASTRPHS